MSLLEQEWKEQKCKSKSTLAISKLIIQVFKEKALSSANIIHLTDIK